MPFAEAEPDIDREELRLALLWQLSPKRLRRLRSGGVLAVLPPGMTLPTNAAVERELRGMRALAVQFLASGDPGFPERLRSIPDPPPYLFVRGAPRLTDPHPRVAVIGSRAATDAGQEIAYMLGRDLALAGVEVWSGMARGIDAAAHRGALEAGGRSVAVCGTGADVCYPPEHGALLRRLLQSGGIVTEFPLGAAGLPLHFPRRNRILAGMADIVVVVEGGERSGARSTVDHALDQGREVMAVPRDPVLPGSLLPNRLLRDGAAPACAARDIVEMLRSLVPAGAGGGLADGAPGSCSARGAGPRDDDVSHGAGARTGGEGAPSPRLVDGAADPETAIMQALSGRRRNLEELVQLRPRIGTGATQALLLRLELEGRIRRSPGGWFHRSG